MHFSHQQRDSSLKDPSDRGGVVAYFSMEIAISPDMSTYSGGLGVLAGDTMRSAADLGLGLCAVTLLHRKGYFRQHLDAKVFRALKTNRGRSKNFCCSKMQLWR